MPLVYCNWKDEKLIRRKIKSESNQLTVDQFVEIMKAHALFGGLIGKNGEKNRAFKDTNRWFLY